MTDPGGLLRVLDGLGVRVFTGVPDSTLKAFCRTLADTLPAYRHIIAANEGSAVGLAAGHYLATGAMACVYMQNSGLGNASNPLISLTAPEVYGIPVLLLIGWRGQMVNGVQTPDEPQHALQGRITLAMLDCLGIPHEIWGPDDDDTDAGRRLEALVRRGLRRSQPVALVVRPGVLDGGREAALASVATSEALTREAALKAAVAGLPPDTVLVATTGKVSRELYEYRLASGDDPRRDFLVVGSMGHALQVASGVALAQPDRRVACIDGDGALIMHMGGLTTSAAVPNLLHLVMNNGAHESTGGLASRGFAIDMPMLAKACGYVTAARADTLDDIRSAIGRAMASAGSGFIEIRTQASSRPDLSRPPAALPEAKRVFMQRLADGRTA